MPKTKKQTKHPVKPGTKKRIPALKKGAKKVVTKKTMTKKKSSASSSDSGARGVIVKTKLGRRKHIVSFRGGCGCGGAV